MLAKRVLVSIITMAVWAGAIFFLPAWWFCMFCGLFIILGLVEFFDLARSKGIFVHKYWVIILGILFSMSYYFQQTLGVEFWELELIAIGIIGLFLFQFARQNGESAIVNISVSLFGLLYIAWFFSFFIKLRYLDNGGLWISFVVLVCKLGDVGAYFIGKRFGRHKLIQRISPNKSIEGSLGGFLTSVLVAYSARLFLPAVSFIHLLILGVLLGILGQLGDLAESLLKRDSQVKDSGRIIPGFGGVLDLIDSLLFTTPVLYFYLTVIMKVQ
ncbi:MAG: phosphatidate cytidylyltransferase [Candidatus Omnitrophota bacterium]|nr:phosphatidate cytidylyltransferase [Candidatus Omnitrophota bacterium]